MGVEPPAFELKSTFPLIVLCISKVKLDLCSNIAFQDAQRKLREELGKKMFQRL